MKPSDTRINPVMESCTNLFNFALLFGKGSRGKNLDQSYGEKIMRAFSEMERLAYDRHLSTDVIKDTKYAMVAFIDEIILSSKWPHRNEWMVEPLQLRYFGEHLAGEGFFERLKQLRQSGERNVDVLELYYVCLQLGFEGMYKLNGYEQLMSLHIDLRSQIENYKGAGNFKLSPHAKPTHGIIHQIRRQVPSWVIGVVTAAIVISIYTTYSFIIDEVADSTNMVITEANENINKALKNPPRNSR